MSTPYRVVESNLQRVAERRKWVELLQKTACLGSVLSVLAMVLAGVILSGWVTDRSLVAGLMVVLGVVAAAVWLGIALSVQGSSLDRGEIASSIEGANRELQDRLNTLVYLERSKGEPEVKPFFQRIGLQAQDVLRQSKRSVPVSYGRMLAHWLVFAALAGGTFFVYERFKPWQALAARAPDAKEQAAEEEEVASVPEPDATDVSLVETNRTWGEVRITKPGRDLQVRATDVIGLEIEAASNERLQSVLWRSAINQGAEEEHALPSPPEPLYAAYQERIDIGKMGLADWDVLTYFARADTASSNAYVSEVYFLEVHPSEEELEKAAGQGGGKNCYDFLKKLTGIIRLQQRIIRETHRHVQTPAGFAEGRAQDREQLAAAESELGGSVKHLGAEMSAALGSEKIQPVLDELAGAEKTVNRTAELLRTEMMEEAQRGEREALQQLVAVRKHFQRVINENPDQFNEEKEPEESPNDSGRDPLKEIAEFRNEAKAARDLLEQTVKQQRDLERRAALNSRAPNLVQEEKKVGQTLEKFAEQHPDLARRTSSELKAAQESVETAATSLEKRNRDAGRRTKEAAEKLEQLQKAVEQRLESQQLADAYKLKEMLDRASQSLGQCEQSPGSMSGAQLEQISTSAAGAVDQLKRMADGMPSRDLFKDSLREALSLQNQRQIKEALEQLKRAETDEKRQQAAAKAGESIDRVREAFDRSVPETLKSAEKNDPLKPGPAEAVDRELSRLEQLLEEMDKPSGPEGNSARQALVNLRQSLDNLEGSNERTPAVLVRLQEELKKREAVSEVADLRRLLEELQKISAEASGRLGPGEQKPDISNIDPARLPPGYRARIEKYFQRLSEQ